MIIAINTRCLNKDEPGECGNYLSEVFQRITNLHSGHTFIFLFDKPFKTEIIFPKNVIPVVTGPQGNTPAKWFIWYNIKIPLLLKKYQADVFVSTGFCSLTTKVPQCLILHDLSFLYFPSFVKKGHLSFYKTYTPRFLKKAKMIITISNFLKTGIADRYKIAQEKIQVAYPGINEIYQPVSMEERESVKEQYAEGNEFFIYLGEINSRNNIMNLLKAFSAFKKRQKSSMQLLIANEGQDNPDELITKLRSYKFRNDVKLLTGLSQWGKAKIIASAYAMVYMPFYDEFGTSLLKAMKSEVPVITSSTGTMHEICGDAALYAAPENFKEIAVKMMQIFKDEKLRKEIIEKGRQRAKIFSWDNTTEVVWNNIVKTMSTKK
ncbi:MAG: glycosyltransferase family 1 protein [Ginsengibacter sp.]